MFQDCEIFLCGTKLDLIKEDQQKRKVDYDSVKYYANGEEFQIVQFKIISPIFTRLRQSVSNFRGHFIISRINIGYLRFSF